MDEKTARFGLPFIMPGQAQKELFHNEAIAGIDIALHPAVEGAPLADPPAAPLPGQCWLVAPNPFGAWAGQAGRLAAWTGGGWRFVVPQAGMCVWDKAAGADRRWTGSAWSAGETIATAIVIGGLQVLGPRQPAVPSPSGGTTIDAEARSALAALTVALKSHGLID
jgi:hypothetical protein